MRHHTATVAYTDPIEGVIGTWIMHDGEKAPEDVAERFGQDYAAIAAWIAFGARRGGYYFVSGNATDTLPRWGEPQEGEVDAPLTEKELEEYGAYYNWHLQEDGTLVPVAYNTTVEMVFLPRESSKL